MPSAGTLMGVRWISAVSMGAPTFTPTLWRMRTVSWTLRTVIVMRDCPPLAHHLGGVWLPACPPFFPHRSLFLVCGDPALWSRVFSRTDHALPSFLSSRTGEWPHRYHVGMAYEHSIAVPSAEHAAGLSYSRFSDGASPSGLPLQKGRMMLARSKGAAPQWRRASALSGFPFWEPNRAVARVLTVDMDYPDSERRLAVACAMGRVPSPDVYVVHDGKGTLQASWWIDPVPARVLADRSHGVGWLYGRVLESLRARLHGDRFFTDARRRNPYCTLGQTTMVSSASCVHSLSSLCAWMRDHDAFDDGHAARSRRRLVASAWRRTTGDDAAASAPVARRSAVEGERNSTVFAAAIGALRNGRDPVQAASSVVCTPPLPAREIRQIVASARRCAARPAPLHDRRIGAGPASASLHELCSQWGAKGGRAGTDRQRRTRRKNLALGSRTAATRHMITRDGVISWIRRYGGTAYRLLAAGGRVCPASVKAVARSLGVSRQTVSRCLQEIEAMIAAGGLEDRGRNPLADAGPVPAVSWLAARAGDALMPMMRSRGWTLLPACPHPGLADGTLIMPGTSAAQGRGGALA